MNKDLKRDIKIIGEAFVKTSKAIGISANYPKVDIVVPVYALKAHEELMYSQKLKRFWNKYCNG